MLLEIPVLGLHFELRGAFASAAIAPLRPRSAGEEAPWAPGQEGRRGQRWGRNRAGDGELVVPVWGEISWISPSMPLLGGTGQAAEDLWGAAEL